MNYVMIRSAKRSQYIYGFSYKLCKLVAIRSRIADPRVGRWTTCFKLWLDARLCKAKLLKSPRMTFPQSGYLLRKYSQ